jgi:hypothetical protein
MIDCGFAIEVSPWFFPHVRRSLSDSDGKPDRFFEYIFNYSRRAIADRGPNP